MIELIALGVCLAGLMIWGLRGAAKFTPPKTSKASKSVLQSYQAVPSLFVNKNEATFFKILSEHIPSEFILLTKVRLEDIIRVKPAIKDPKMIWHLRGRIKSRHVDFLIIDKAGKPVLAIELDGPVHKSASSFNADALKDGIFKSSGLKLKRVSTGDDFRRFSQRAADYLGQLNHCN